MNHTSIIIVNYNTPSDTNDCLASIDAMKVRNHRLSIIVVDNASQNPYVLPKELQQVGRSATKQYQVVRSESNLGFTGGNNLGIHYAIEKHNSDAVLLLNSDTTVDPELLNQLLSFVSEHPLAGIVSPKIYFTGGHTFHKSYDQKQAGRVIWYGGGSIDWQHVTAFHRNVDEVDRGQCNFQHTSDFATGCCMLIKREVLEKVGTFDKRYFLYLEDVDLSVRARSLGYEIGFCESAVVFHKNAGSSDGVGSEVQTYYQTRNRLLFAFKHGNWFVKLTAVRLGFRDCIEGNRVQRTAVYHAVMNRFGKQPII